MDNTIHYNDGAVDVRYINENDFNMIVLVNSYGQSKVLSYDDNFYSDYDLLEAYIELWRLPWYSNETQDQFVAKFKAWLIETGSEPEDLEQC